MTRKYRYEFEWGIDKLSQEDEFEVNTEYFVEDFELDCYSEFDAVVYAVEWMERRGIDSSSLMYCRVEEVFDSEMRTNVLLWIGE